MLKGVDELQVECSILHRKITVGWEQVLELTDTRNPGPAFIAPETREAAARDTKKFKEAHRAALAAGYPDLIATTRIPGNPAAWELAAEIPIGLLDQVRTITVARLRHEGVCVLRRLRTIGPRDTLLANVRELIWDIPTRTCAERVLRDLGNLAERIEVFVDGEDRSVLDTVCPHCGHRSLVAYLETGVIRCERPRDKDTGLRPRCKCNQPLCQCQVDPTHFHTWFRDSRDPTSSWTALETRLRLTRRSKEHR